MTQRRPNIGERREFGTITLWMLGLCLMLFLLGALHATGRFDVIARGYSPASREGLFVYGVVIALTYLCAWLFSRATERQTWRARRALKRALKPRPLAAAGVAARSEVYSDGP